MYMKTKTIIVAGLLVGLFSTSVAFGAIKLIKAEDFARVDYNGQVITISRVIDGETTCYVSRHSTFGAHSISCVK